MFDALHRNIGKSGISFCVVEGGSRVIPTPPRFVFGPFPADLAAMFYRRTDMPSLGTYSIERAEVSLDFLITLDGTAYSCFEANIHPLHVQDRLNVSPSPTTIRHAEGKCVLLAGPGQRVFGHWLVDFLPKLVILQMSGYDIDSLKYIIPSDSPMFARKLLDMVGISAEKIIEFNGSEEKLVVDELLVPPILHNGVRAACVFKDAVDLLVKRATLYSGYVDAVPTRDIFVSRSKTSQSRNLRNREEREKIAQDSGYELIYPETMEMIDQARTFSSARRIVGEYGSAMHWSMFSSPGTFICTIRGARHHPAFIQFGIGSVLAQPTGLVLGEADSSDINTSFFVEKDAVINALEVMR